MGKGDSSSNELFSVRNCIVLMLMIVVLIESPVRVKLEGCYLYCLAPLNVNRYFKIL